MKRLIALLLVCAISAPLTGCYTTSVIVDQNYNPSKQVADYEAGWQMFAIAGLIPISATVMLNQVCPNAGAGIVETETTFLNGLVSGIIGNLISFRTARVMCKSGAAAEVDIDSQGRVIAVRPIED